MQKLRSESIYRKWVKNWAYKVLLNNTWPYLIVIAEHLIHDWNLQTNSTKWSNDNFLMEDTEDGRKRVKSFSLMTEVPENRTCENAGIPDSFCSCHQIKEMDMEANLTDIVKGENTDMKDARNAAVALVQEINQVLKKHFDICFKCGY